MNEWPIVTPQKFAEVLSQVDREIDARLSAVPSDAVLQVLQTEVRQLTTWTANNAVPTPEDMSSLNMGILVIKELEPRGPAWMALIRRLTAVRTFAEKWAEIGPSPCEHLQAIYDRILATGASFTDTSFTGARFTKLGSKWLYFQEPVDSTLETPPNVNWYERRGTHDGSEAGFICASCNTALLGPLDPL